VIVVDSCPSYTGRDVVQRLSNAGIKCKYTLIQGVSAFITHTTKVFIGASYVLGNGGCVSSIGTSMVAYLASQHKVPVITLCETYKFTQRVNLD
jgi:translation initiation factor eIF-2B subunit delta